MKKVLAASLLVMTLAAQAEAGCLTLTNRYAGSIPAKGTVTAYGPVTIVNGSGCHSVIVAARAQPLGSGLAPKMWIEKLVDGRWEALSGNQNTSASVITTAGTFRIRHYNEHSVLRAYSGNITTTR